MKKQNSKPLSEAVFVNTIQELREIFLTKGDLKDFATKIDLVGLEFRMNEKFDLYDEKNKEYRDEILTKIDSFAKRIVELEDEEEVGTYQMDKLKSKVDDHNKRITKLETKN